MITPAIETALKRLKAAKMRLSWYHPFFAIPAGRIRITPTDAVPTAAITARGRIYASPTYIGTLSDAQVVGLLAHEICHPLLGHHTRVGSRVPQLWNIATDMAINTRLRTMRLELPEGALYPDPAWESWSAEQIYDELAQDLQAALDAHAGDGDPTPGAGCGVQSDAASTDGVGDAPADARPWDQRSDVEVAAEWRAIAVQAAEVAHRAGRTAGHALTDLINPPPARLPWRRLLRHAVSQAVAAAGRDHNTWAKRGRRSPAVGPQLPGWRANAPTLAIAVDSSASVDDDMLRQALSEILAAVRATHAKAYLAVHDTVLQWEGWIGPTTSPREVAAAVGKGRGGTDPRPAYDAIARQRAQFSAFVHLTDCEVWDWPDQPRNTRNWIVARLTRGGDRDRYAGPARARVVDVQIN